MSSRARTTGTARPLGIVLRLTVAAALVAAATAATSFDRPEPAAEAPSSAVVRTVTVTPTDRVEPRSPEDTRLAADLAAAVEARTQLVAAAPAPEPEPEPEPEAPAEPASTGPDAGVWDRVAQCESGGNWSINTGNGFYGGLQFELESWQWVGGNGYPHENSKAEQIRRAEILLERQGWVAWPACSKKLGLR